MTRRSRSAALLSAGVLLAGAGLSLVLAPTASAADGPDLGALTIAPAAPAIGDTVFVSGSGCLGLPDVPPLPTGAPSVAAVGGAAVGGATSGAVTAGAAAPAAPAAPAAAASSGAAAADDPDITSVDIVISGPDGSSNDSATTDGSGQWTGASGILVSSPGQYTVQATCNIGPEGSPIGFPYASTSFTIATPAPVVDPAVSCTGCDDVNPGGTITLVGTGFPAGATATVALAGYGSKPGPIDAGGGFGPVSFRIAPNQAPARLSGGVSAPGARTQPFSVLVTAPDAAGSGTADGDVPGDDADSTDPSTGTGAADTTPTTDDPVVNYTAAAPTLPNTGTDTVWPGVIGGLLVVSGGGLLWAGRRRDAAGGTTA